MPITVHTRYYDVFGASSDYHSEFLAWNNVRLLFQWQGKHTYNYTAFIIMLECTTNVSV
jgi:hypothetical protein